MGTEATTEGTSISTYKCSVDDGKTGPSHILCNPGMIYNIGTTTTTMGLSMEVADTTGKVGSISGVALA